MYKYNSRERFQTVPYRDSVDDLNYSMNRVFHPDFLDYF